MKEQEPDFFDETQAMLKGYVEDRMLLLKMQVAEKSGKLLSAFISFLIVAFFSFFILFFVSIMGGYYFAEKTGSMFYGFSIIAGIYIFLFILFLTLNKQFSKQVINAVIRIFFERRGTEKE